MQLPEHLMIEWSTGRDASGAESHAFALDWSDSVTPFGRGRAYRRSTSRLGAVLGRTMPVLSTNVRYAAGVDGEADVRIEVEALGNKRQVFRWRPAGGFDQADVGGPCLLALARAKSLDVAKARVEDTADALSALKRERNRLRDMREAGARVDAELAMVAAQDRQVRAEHDRMHQARKSRAIAELEVTRGS